MDTIASLKEQTDGRTPLLLLDVALASGETERWATHGATVGGETYAARVIAHNLFEVQAAADGGIDAIPRISLTLANADSRLSQIEAAAGFKGAALQASFLFYDTTLQAPASERVVLFRGVLNPPEEITETAFRLTAVNRMNMQRVLLPPVRIERRCPWNFPATAEERQEAIAGGSEGRYSRYYGCGYSAGEPGGEGNLDGGAPFTSCNFTRGDCEARGMFSADGASQPTRRFGGAEFVPASVLVRSNGARERTAAAVSANEARYNDFVPLVYGTAWVEPPVVFARNDGNLTRMQALVATGEIEGVVKVVVNGVEIPAGEAGRTMTATGWWNQISDGGRTGGFDLNFTDGAGNPLGDPYGGMAALSVVVPNQIGDGRSLPRVRVLVRGARLERFGEQGAFVDRVFSANPAWVLLDLLRRSGWRSEELDLGSFAAAAAVCDEAIAATDNAGNPISVERFRCNLAIRERRTAAEAIRGVRNCARLQLTYRDDGRLAAFVEDSLLRQQPEKPAGSNAPSMVNGGWPAYAYTDGSVVGVAAGILRRSDRSLALRFWSRPIADSPNRYSVEFADEFNEYRQDSLSIVDSQDLKRTGQEITGRLAADGLPSFDQAARVLRGFLDKSLRGNRFVEFETGPKALGQRPGDIVTLTVEKEGLFEQPFRIVKLAPGANYRTVRVTAQWHDDAWYNDTNGQLTALPVSPRPADADAGTPFVLWGDEEDEYGQPAFGVVEFGSAAADGSILSEIEVSFRAPSTGASTRVGPPMVPLQPTVLADGGQIAGGSTFYYAVTATDAEGREGRPSFTVRAPTPAGGSTYRVRLSGLRFPAEAESFSVYRGESPTALRRIAASQAIAAEFEDSGLAAELEGAPDPNFHHANFYWRFESSDEQFATVYGPDSVGSGLLEMTVGSIAGRTVRLLRGVGVGQERKIVDNDGTTLWVEPAWDIEPDQTTVFVVSESTWRFGGRASASPARFAVPNLAERVVQISGRAANARNVESLEGLSLVTRWRIGGGGLGVPDLGPPPEPLFGVDARRDGTYRLNGLSFESLQNTQTISNGVWTLDYRTETRDPDGIELAAAVDAEETGLVTSLPLAVTPGDLLQMEMEIVRVEEADGTALQVSRGMCGSSAATHNAGTVVERLERRVETLGFGRGFFGSLEATDWSSTVWLPSARLACSRLQLTNALGDSPIGAVSFMGLTDRGLRSLNGGQFQIQVDGPLGILDDAAPILAVQRDLSIRDIFAGVKVPSAGSPVLVAIRQNGDLLASVEIATGLGASDIVPGRDLPYLREGATLTVDIMAVGSVFPGADLTVTIRV